MSEQNTHQKVMKLFQEQSMLISKTGSEVSIRCDNSNDANAMFDWLTSITGTYGSVEDWLNEIESFSLRQERMDVSAIAWAKAAFEAGCSRKEKEQSDE